MRYKFSGHQTFAFRHGWLEKGVDLIRTNPHGFLDDDAIVKLGVGKNMVDSIKYWCVQTGLLCDAATSGDMQLTEFAKFIFGEDKDSGVDPYLEDDATLWLLHHKIVTNESESSISIAFNSLNKPEFSKPELLAFINRYLDGKAVVSTKTLERDIDCFIHVYAGTRGKNIEDNFDCPFLALALVQPTIDQNLFRMNIGSKQSLPSEFVGYALLDIIGDGSNTINLYSATYDSRSPGQVFKLNEDDVVSAINDLERKTDGKFSFTDTAGLNSIRIDVRDGRSVLAKSLLTSYYGGHA